MKRVQAFLKDCKIHGSWPSPDRFHLTLAFLGNIPLTRVNTVKKAMLDAALENPGFELTIDRLGVFPGLNKARVIWAGLHRKSPELHGLYHNLYTKLKAEDLFSTQQRFIPHITLTRIKKNIRREKLKPILEEDLFVNPAPFHVKYMDLYESRLTRSGAVHTRIYRADL
ncbi:MAG: RNA 2',3'-cyclic phosphodiesterase [Desulfobacterales bacterium]|nr:RNA 2',3'-cyclic phosphodiesterase [Desulfobacterales bacterium]